MVEGTQWAKRQQLAGSARVAKNELNCAHVACARVACARVACARVASMAVRISCCCRALYFHTVHYWRRSFQPFQTTPLSWAQPTHKAGLTGCVETCSRSTPSKHFEPLCLASKHSRTFAKRQTMASKWSCLGATRTSKWLSLLRCHENGRRACVY